MPDLQIAHWIQEVQSTMASQLKRLVQQRALKLLTSFFALVVLVRLRSLRLQQIDPPWLS